MSDGCQCDRKKIEGGAPTRTPRPTSDRYDFKQPQAVHSHVSHVQISPLQLGHLHPSQAQPDFVFEQHEPAGSLA
jgi:hypothetical protein